MNRKKCDMRSKGGMSSATTISPLRVYRVARGLSQRELAALAGCRPETISRLESGSTLYPRERVRLGIADALGVEPEMVFPVEVRS